MQETGSRRAFLARRTAPLRRTSQDIQLIYRGLPPQHYGHNTNRGVSNKQETSDAQEFRDRTRRRGRPRDGARLRELCAAEPAGMVARLRDKVWQALRRRRRERRERLSGLDDVSHPIILRLNTPPFVPALSRG